MFRGKKNAGGRRPWCPGTGMEVEKVEISPEDFLIPWEDTEYNLTQNSVAGEFAYILLLGIQMWEAGNEGPHLYVLSSHFPLELQTAWRIPSNVT